MEEMTSTGRKGAEATLRFRLKKAREREITRGMGERERDDEDADGDFVSPLLNCCKLEGEAGIDWEFSSLLHFQLLVLRICLESLVS